MIGSDALWYIIAINIYMKSMYLHMFLEGQYHPHPELQENTHCCHKQEQTRTFSCNQGLGGKHQQCKKKFSNFVLNFWHIHCWIAQKINFLLSACKNNQKILLSSWTLSGIAQQIFGCKRGTYFWTPFLLLLAHASPSACHLQDGPAWLVGVCFS